MYQFQAGQPGYQPSFGPLQPGYHGNYAPEARHPTAPHPAYTAAQQAQYSRYNYSAGHPAGQTGHYPGYAVPENASYTPPAVNQQQFTGYPPAQPPHVSSQHCQPSYPANYAQPQYHVPPNTGPLPMQHNQATQFGHYPPPQYGYPQSSYPMNPQFSEPYAAPATHVVPQQPPASTFRVTKEYPKAKPTDTSCYNCGNPSHWAQDCPEPRRAVPVGEMNRTRSVKRQKTTDAVPTQYTSPIQPPPSLQRGWTQPLPETRGFSGSSAPPTPASHNGYAQPGWPQAPHFDSQTKKYGPAQQPFGIPTPVSPYDSQFSSPAGPPGVATQPVHQPHVYQTYNQAPPGHHGYFSSATHPPAPPAESLSHQPGDHVYETPRSLRDDSTASEKPAASTPANEDGDSLLEELQALDEAVDKSVTAISGQPAALCQKPLPPPYNEHQARQHMGADVQLHEAGDHEKLEHDSTQLDPVFFQIKAKCEVVEFAELVARRNQERGGGNQGGDKPSDDSDGRSDHNDEASRTSMSPEPAPDDPDASFQETEAGRLSREQEERLAALGVSGTAKPVRPSICKLVVSTNPLPRTDSTASQSPASPSRQSSHEASQHTVQTTTPSQHGTSQSSPKSFQADYVGTAHGVLQHRGSDTSKGYFDDSLSSPAEFSHSRHTNEQRRSSIDQPHAPEQIPIPSRRPPPPPPDRSRSNHGMSRKRSYRQSSEESDEGPKRQNNEPARPYRSRAPKVAAAYSRRW